MWIAPWELLNCEWVVVLSSAHLIFSCGIDISGPKAYVTSSIHKDCYPQNNRIFSVTYISLEVVINAPFLYGVEKERDVVQRKGCVN